MPDKTRDRIAAAGQNDMRMGTQPPKQGFGGDGRRSRGTAGRCAIETVLRSTG